MLRRRKAIVLIFCFLLSSFPTALELPVRKLYDFGAFLFCYYCLLNLYDHCQLIIVVSFRYVMHCLMVESCASSARAACARLHKQHRQRFQAGHPQFAMPTSLASSHVAVLQSLSSATPSFYLEFFLSLEPVESLIFLLLLARQSPSRATVYDLLNLLPGWAAYSLGLRFEGYDVLRDSLAQQHRHMLPLDCEEYFGEVFEAGDSSEIVKHGMLKKGQQFTKEVGKCLLGRLAVVDDSDCDDSDSDEAATKRTRSPTQ